MDCEGLRKAYEIIYSDGDLTEAVWSPARDALRAIADRAVRKCSKTYRVPRFTWSDLIDEVEGALTCKVAKKGLGPPGDIDNFDSFMNAIAWRQTISVLRKIKSPLASAEMVEDHRECGEPMSQWAKGASLLGGDPLTEIRSRMGPFRFPEFSLCRDMLLTMRLAVGAFPGPAAFRVVPSGSRTAAYNAAVFDINTAMFAGSAA